MSFGDGFTPVDSGHIDAVKYEPMEKRLTVRFQNGYHYEARGVSPEDYQAFFDAPSPGEHYHAVLKQNYEIERVK